jgi:hypothetical protein
MTIRNQSENSIENQSGTVNKMFGIRKLRALELIKQEL